MKLSVIGTGYVGLVTGVCLADFGNEVVCLDINAEKIALLQSGESPIYEPGLDSLIRKNVQANRLSFSTDPHVLGSSDIIFVAVGTPPQDNGDVDTRQLESAAKTICEYGFKNTTNLKVVINKSTVPVGTGRKFESLFSELGKDHSQFGIVSNPEFLREGNAIEDFFKPDRIVLGGHHTLALQKVRELYRPFEMADVPFYVTSLETAELIKYASNAFLATKISFINDMANLCEKVGADVSVLSKAMGADHRIGPHFLNPGPGYGGSCFPKDTKALIKIASNVGLPLDIVEAAEAVNTQQKAVFFHKINDHFNHNLDAINIAVLGLAFKPDTDDMREAPAIPLIQRLVQAKAKLSVFDPVALENSRSIFGDTVRYCSSAFEAVEGADAVLFLTEWNDFKVIDLPHIKTLLKQPLIFDARNMYLPARMKELGFTYISLGRPH
jgi:UDPglucose 6-dehydrogenase